MLLRTVFQVFWLRRWNFRSSTVCSHGSRTPSLELMLFICRQYSQVYWQLHLFWRLIGRWFYIKGISRLLTLFYFRCCVPAFLDLWLSQDRFYLGLTLVLVHFIIPSNFNVMVHSEIKGIWIFNRLKYQRLYFQTLGGGHPYLTALSIIGGIGFFGIQGAILGNKSYV